MNVLFERFVTKLITDATIGTSLAVDPQSSLRAVIRNDLDGKTYKTVRPDLVIEDRATHRRVPIDVKYKRYDLKNISTGDIYQTFLYGYALQSADGRARAGIVYPTLDNASEHRLSIHNAAGATGARIIGTGLNIPEILDMLDGDAALRSACQVAMLGLAVEFLGERAAVQA